MSWEATQLQAPGPRAPPRAYLEKYGEGKVTEPLFLGWTSFGSAPAVDSQTWLCVGVLWGEV